jgi:hypothetical protein
MLNDKTNKGPDRSVADLLKRTHEVQGDEVLYRFGNGLTVKTEIFRKNDRLRILPLGSPQGSLMNYMLNFPDVVNGKEIFEPFAGSGAIGCMALKAGARHVDFLDVNPRASIFQVKNAGLNHFPANSYRNIVGVIETFSSDRPYDLIVANPPFVPTPGAIEGMITSNGGPEGNRFAAVLLRRLEQWLRPDGQAFICLFQIVRRGKPLVAELISKYLDRRIVELTPSQARPISFEVYCRTYGEVFSHAKDDIAAWRAGLIDKYGENLMLSHYVAHVKPRSDRPTVCVIRNNFKEKYGETLLVHFADDRELAYARILENVLNFETA